MPVECFQIHAADNVATLLQDAGEGTEVQVLGEDGRRTIHTTQAIRAAHKVALRPIAAGEPVIKYAFPIGEATHPIAEGEWVHLHNCRSFCDALSSELDIDSGSRTETRYV